MVCFIISGVRVCTVYNAFAKKGHITKSKCNVVDNTPSIEIGRRSAGSVTKTSLAEMPGRSQTWY